LIEHGGSFKVLLKYSPELNSRFSISKESIIDVFATVKTVDVPVEGCSQKNVELHVKVRNDFWRQNRFLWHSVLKSFFALF